MNDVLVAILQLTIICILSILVLLKPYFGIICTLANLPMVDLLPKIPFLSSIVILIGAFTLVGFLLQGKKLSGKPLFNFQSVHVVGLLFVGWIFISNPQAAWFGTDRNWILTFLQLWVLTWLAGELLDSPKKQHIFMWIFSVVCAISAFISVQQGHIAESVNESFRATGLANQPNASARYFVVAMIFFTYLGMVTKQRFPRLLAIVGIVVTFLGVFFTLSRTGILLLFAAIGLQLIFNTRRKLNYLAFFAYIIAALVMWFLSDDIINIIKSIFPSILQGTDTIGLRYTLWRAGLRMWLDHIFQGVGIGMFPDFLRFYSPGLPARYWTLGGHDTYLNILAETGLIGLGLFLLLLFLSTRNFLQMEQNKEIEFVSLRNVWLIVFLIVLLGGSTLNGQHDKLLWFLMGVSVYFHNQFSRKPQMEASHEPLSSIQLTLSKKH